MPTYILQLPGSDFTGFRGGVDFYEGKGSTSSKADADLLVSKFSCLIIEPEPKSEIKVRGASEEVSLAIPTPADETPKVFVNRADRELYERTIRRLGGDVIIQKKGRKK